MRKYLSIVFWFKESDIDENILDQSILDILFDQTTNNQLSADDILNEIEKSDVMTVEEMDNYISKLFEEEEEPKGEHSLLQVCFLLFESTIFYYFCKI